MKYIYNVTVTETCFVTTNMEKAEDILFNEITNRCSYMQSILFQF